MSTPQDDEGYDNDFLSSTTTESILSMGIETTFSSTGLRLWQMLFICGSSIMAIVILLCCCIRFRIPRTKQEIEADYVRKKITRKFQAQLKLIQNSEMDEMDLKKAMDRIRAEFKSSDSESLERSEIYSGGSLNSAAGTTHTGQGSPHNPHHHHPHHQAASPHIPHVHIDVPPEEKIEESSTGGGLKNRLANIARTLRFTSRSEDKSPKNDCEQKN